MPNAAAELLILGLLIIANGLLTAAETAFVSARAGKLDEMAEAGSSGARAALPIAEHPGRFLGLVQFWLTLSCVTAGVALVASAASEFSSLFAKWPALSPWAEGTGLVAGTLFVSCVMLLFGELLPKRIALAHPERAAVLLAPLMRLLSRVVGPISAVLGSASEGLASALGFKARPVTELVGDEDVRALVERGLHAGVFKRAKKEMVEGVLSLDNLKITAIMTPRSKIVFLNIDDNDEANWRKIVTSGHSYFPVFQKNRDQVVGMVSVKALWAHSAIGLPTALKNLLVPPLIAPEGMTAVHLLEQFKKTGRHTAIVSDEFGAVQGMVTLIDVFEAIVGDLPEPGQRNQPGAKRRDDGTWLVDATMPLADFKATLGIERPMPNEAEAEYRTAGGFVVTQFGRIPAVGDRFDWAGWRFEVSEMDKRRVDKLVVAPLQAELAKPAP
ncbi:MAG TPA: hemolysin family protein [Opitutaceae bacterium]|jgi:putative hemolysin|nr:hemolysin family protein [Opitutaceae bacterium]